MSGPLAVHTVTGMVAAAHWLALVDCRRWRRRSPVTEGLDAVLQSIHYTWLCQRYLVLTTAGCFVWVPCVASKGCCKFSCTQLELGYRVSTKATPASSAVIVNCTTNYSKRWCPGFSGTLLLDCSGYAAVSLLPALPLLLVWPLWLLGHARSTAAAAASTAAAVAAARIRLWLGLNRAA
jgi:hypothetical protein